jgi:hypothetical protein
VIIVTETAKRHFHKLRPEEGDDPDEHEGEPLLYVSRKVSAAFDGCVVDLVDTPEGVGFSVGPSEAGRDARS